MGGTPMLRKMHVKFVARTSRPSKAHMGGTQKIQVNMAKAFVARASRPWKAHMGGTPMLQTCIFRLLDIICF
jgi:hypothetical protein